MSKPAASTYRAILRRHVPEPLLALLIFVTGVWLWDNHFSVRFGYEEGTSRVALRKIDRDLRLADSAADLPLQIRRMLGIPTRDEAFDTGLLSLRMLERDRSLDESGTFALEVLRASSGGKAMILPLPPDPIAVAQRVEAGEEWWWDREYLARIRSGPVEGVSTSGAVRENDPRGRELLLRVIMARGGVCVLALCGMVFIPAALKGFAAGLRRREQRYPDRWPLGLGLAVFLSAYLASIGFGRVLEIMISRPWAGEAAHPVPIPPALFAMLDAATRFLPPLLAIAFLFRRGSHAWDRLGLGRRPEWKQVIGGFAMLVLLDLAIRQWFGTRMPLDPTGGLSASEEGRWGLVLAVTSACLAAPVAEEILFRGVLFRSLSNGLRVPAAALVSAVVFSVVHFYDAYGLLSVGLLGVVCALAYASSGSLLTAIILHALYNFTIKIPEWIVYHAPL